MRKPPAVFAIFFRIIPNVSVISERFQCSLDAITALFCFYVCDDMFVIECQCFFRPSWICRNSYTTLANGEIRS
jgi:hypothetical protein